MTLDERLHEAKLSIYIPASEAAVCADCSGVFLYVNGQCPGCGSKQWVLLEPSPFAARKDERYQRRVMWDMAKNLEGR